MPYEIKITQVTEGYVGEVASKGEVLFKTSALKDTSLVTKEITDFVRNKTKSDRTNLANTKNKNSIQMNPLLFHVNEQVTPGNATKKCCGRG